MTTLSNLRTAYRFEATANMIRFAKSKRFVFLTVDELIMFGNKPRGRAVKVANRLIKLELDSHLTFKNWHRRDK